MTSDIDKNNNAVNESPATDFEYLPFVNSTYCSITNYIGNDERVVIPAEINGYKVERIGERLFHDRRSGRYYGAFEDNEKIKTIEIPEGVKIIDVNAFRGCRNLESVKIPDSVKLIFKDAFAGCVSMERLEIPEGAKIIDNNGEETNDLSLIVDEPTIVTRKEAAQKKAIEESPVANELKYAPVYLEGANKDPALFKESLNKSIECINAIKEAIDKNYDYDRSHLNTDFVKDVINEYGAERVNHVLATIIQRADWDNRYSRENKEWAETIPVSKIDRVRSEITTDAHPVFLNAFVNKVREIEKEIGNAKKNLQPTETAREKRLIKFESNNAVSRAQEKNSADKILAAIESNGANLPFFPKEDGTLSPYSIINANTGSILNPKDLISMQLKKADNGEAYKSNVVMSFSGARKAEVQILKDEIPNAVTFNFLNKENQYKAGRWYFAEQTTDPNKAVTYAQNKQNERAVNSPERVDPPLNNVALAINSPEEYLPKYLAACRTGARVKVSKEIAEEFKSQLKEICNNTMRINPNRVTPTLHSALVSANEKATEIIKDAARPAVEIAKEREKVYQPITRKRDVIGYAF